MPRRGWAVAVLAGLLVVLAVLLAAPWFAPRPESHTFELAVVEETTLPVIAINETVRDTAPDLVRALQHTAEEGHGSVRSYPFRKQLYETIWASDVGPNVGIQVAFDLGGTLIEIVGETIVD